jgi:hypothetical protein
MHAKFEDEDDDEDEDDMRTGTVLEPAAPKRFWAAVHD